MSEETQLPPPPVSIDDLARRHGVTASTVRRWVGKRAICPVGGFKARIKPMSFAVAEIVRFENGGAK